MNIDDTNGPKMPKVDVDWCAGGWQPIETAPKDGTSILVYIPLNNWGCEVVEWDKRGGSWYVNGDDAIWSHPTHWRPLPPPPPA